MLHDQASSPGMSAGVRQTVGRLILDLDLMLAHDQDPNARRDILVHLIIELAGHLCRTEGFQESSRLYAVVAEAAHHRRMLSPKDMPQILRSWHERLCAEERPAPIHLGVSTIPTIPRPREPSPIRPATAKPQKPKIGFLRRELARSRH